MTLLLQSLLFAVLGSIWVSAHAALLDSPTSTRPANSTIDIPEGTPVSVHFFGSAQAALNSCNLGNAASRAREIVLQVDQDVIVSGTVVVPRGSVGLATCDQERRGKFKQEYGDVKVHTLYGTRTVHPKGPTTNGVVQYTFHNLYVFSIASTQLDLDPAPDFIDLGHHNAEYGSYGLEFDVNSQFTAKLKHAVVTLPPPQ